MIRVLGKGLTALAIKNKFLDEVELYDDKDFDELYNKSSDELTIVSPGIPPSNNMVKNSNNIISEYDYFCKEAPLSIWISGTNGKTTTTQMCEHILKEYGCEVGGNIGNPLANLDIKKNIWILETSSFTLHYTKNASPNIYILLPISEDHIYWHGSFEEYTKAKLSAMDRMREGDIAIIPAKFQDYPTKAMKIHYEESEDIADKFGIDISKINFSDPFLMDALMAMSTQKILFDKIDYEKINSFKVDSHKIEEFYDKSNNLWVDDSKATNVDATINGIKKYLDKEIHLILGGDDKGADLTPLFLYLQGQNIKIYAIGRNTKRIIEFSKQFSLEVYECQELEKAVKKIGQNIDKKGVGILSPAAASLDQFSSYKHRGEKFKEFVSNLSLI